jgi:PTH1 family peptidyl-tRNA hydrolase
MSIKLIIGLRNPGAEYAQTRHNAGEWFIDALSKHYPICFNIEKAFQGEVGQLVIDNNKAKILLPLTYMNLSGQPTRAISQFYRLTPEQILVVHDDLDLPIGILRLKTGGGHGGHNGLKDITSHLGTNTFHRLRIGIGHPGDKSLVHNYVLGKPSLQDKSRMQENFEQGIQLMPLILSGDIARAMNTLNQ